MRIRAISFSFLFAALAALPSVALSSSNGAKERDPTIARVFTGWRDAASFKRISEYFDGHENTGGQLVLRTHPDQRAGYYYLVRIANPGATLSVKINLQVISTADAKVRTYTFATDLGSGDPVLNLGLTGADWPDAKVNPVAWKLDVMAADGRVLATEKSYLWEKPAAK